MNKLEEIRKISTELKCKGIFTIDFMAVEYAENQEQFEKIINAYYNSPNKHPIKELIENLLPEEEKYRVYHSRNFGGFWTLNEIIKTSNIKEEMDNFCGLLGNDYLYDNNLRVVYNSYGEIYAYLNKNESKDDLKNKRMVVE